MAREYRTDPLPIASFDAELRLRVDENHDLHVDEARITRAGGWLRVGCEDPRIPRVLQWITVHLRADTDAASGRTSVSIDRIRYGDMEWTVVDEFLELFHGVWTPHLVEQTLRALRTEKRQKAHRESQGA